MSAPSVADAARIEQRAPSALRLSVAPDDHAVIALSRLPGYVAGVEIAVVN
jgi:hypothetical protein